MSRFLLCISILIVFPAILCSAQGWVGNKVFTPIPTEQQPRLIVRLKEQIENERKRDWASMFALMPKEHTQRPNLTLETFVLGQDRWKTKSRYVLDFIPRSTMVNITIDADYLIYGCAKSKNGLFAEWSEASIAVAFENGDWFIDQVQWVFPAIHANPRKCKPDKKDNPLALDDPSS